MKNNPQFRVIDKGFKCLAPYDAEAEEVLHKYGINTILSADISKSRYPKFHRLIFGGFAPLLINNIKDFHGFNRHKVLKRLQMEGGIECEEMMLRFKGVRVIRRMPESLSYASMDQSKFEGVFESMKQHVCTEYWPNETPEGIDRMIEEQFLFGR